MLFKDTFTEFLNPMNAGNHKSIRWNAVIHSGIDGYFWLNTYIHCSDNNQFNTVFNYFREGTEEFSVPSRIRANCDGENMVV